MDTIALRLVAKGFTQIPGIDYDETFSPVARFESLQLLLALAALEDWEIQQIGRQIGVPEWHAQQGDLYGATNRIHHIQNRD